jgi:hypothetical protein
MVVVMWMVDGMVEGWLKGAGVVVEGVGLKQDWIGLMGRGLQTRIGITRRRGKGDVKGKCQNVAGADMICGESGEGIAGEGI